MFDGACPVLSSDALLFYPTVSPAAGTDHEVAAADPPAAGAGDGLVQLERGPLLRAVQGGEAPSSGSAGDAAGGREAAEAAAESPAAERPSECPTVLPQLL